MDKDGEGGIVLSIDLNKAFDRVEHSFIEQTMRRFGFGERILRWISLLYNNAKSCVKVNGVLTDPFPLERSVRQGCPLSALLYSITICEHILEHAVWISRGTVDHCCILPRMSFFTRCLLSKLSVGSVFVAQYKQSSQVQYGSQPRPAQAEVHICSSYTEGKK